MLLILYAKVMFAYFFILKLLLKLQYQRTENHEFKLNSQSIIWVTETVFYLEISPFRKSLIL